jgi:von Willebrand factor type A domain
MRPRRKTSLVMPRRKLSTHFALAAGIAFALSNLASCNRESEAPPPVKEIKVHALKLVYPPEARNLVAQVVERINAKNLALGNGSTVRVSASSLDNIAAFDKVGTPQMPAGLWIAPYSPLAASVKRTSQSDVSITDCNSVMSSRLGVAYRKIDAFAIPQKEGAVGTAQMLPSGDNATEPALSVIAGAPRFTSSGIATSLAAAAEATSSPLASLTSDSIVRGSKLITNTQRWVRNYFTSDYDTLLWLNERQGGEPVAVFTTEQGFKTHKIYTPSSTLMWSPITSPALTLDYPLCNVTTKGDSAQDVEAAKLVRLFFAGDEFKSMLEGAGFSTPLTLDSLNLPQLGAAAATLIKEWPRLRRPSMTIFVVDASIKTDRATMETIRREIKLFIESRPSPDDLVAIISASSSPEIVSDPTANPETLTLALGKLSTVGGNAIRDGVQTAFTLFSDLSTKEYRRAVVVFTSGKDTSSQTSTTQFANRASQLVGRKNVDLYVLGLGTNDTDFGELPLLVQQSGGAFIRTSLASLPADLFPVARRVQ